MTYLVVKWLHLIGAALLFGTGLGIAFFAWFGYRRGMRDGDIGLVRGVLRLTVIADTVFTAVAAFIVQPVTGYVLWRLTGGQWPDRWLLWVIGLYAFVGACWLPVVWLQVKLRDDAVVAASTADLPARFHQRFRTWFLLGFPAFLGVMALYVLMLTRTRFL